MNSKDKVLKRKKIKGWDQIYSFFINFLYSDKVGAAFQVTPCWAQRKLPFFKSQRVKRCRFNSFLLGVCFSCCCCLQHIWTHSLCSQIAWSTGIEIVSSPSLIWSCKPTPPPLSLLLCCRENVGLELCFNSLSACWRLGITPPLNSLH